MGAVVVVVVSPSADQLSGVAQAGEQVLVEALVPKPPVETLDQTVLHRFAGGDVMPLDTALFLPSQDGVRGQLRSVVADHHAGTPPELGDPIEFAGDPLAGERGVDDGSQALPAYVVDDAEHPEPPSAGQAVGYEVQ